MNKKRTKTIRILLVLLVMLTTGGVQRVWADVTLDDINTRLAIIAPDGSGCTAEATSYQTEPAGHCDLLKVVLKVKPASGYYTKLDFITATDGASQDNPEAVDTEFEKFIGDVCSVDEADTDPTKDYSNERTITIYWGDDNSCNPTTSNIHIFVKFEPIGLKLLNGLGENNATVTIFDGGEVTYDSESKPTNAPTPESFTIPTSSAITSIDNSDGKDRYIIVHIEPADGYWTDESLLCAYEAGATAALARAAAPGIDMGQPLKLLKADEYNAALPGDDPDMKPCHNGSGWYYYKLSGSHKFSFEKTGYKYSIIDGFAPKQFYLNGSNVWDPTNKVLTVTDGTTNGWSVEFTYDKVSYPFDGNNHRPKVDKLTVKYQGKTVIEYDGSTAAGRAAIDNQVVNGDGNDDCIIRDSHTINTNAAQPYPYCWFISGDYDAKFAITVPFSGSGTEADPWLIKGGADLTMLAKCVNIGYYSFMNQYVVLDKTCAYDVAADYAEFEPIGMKGEIHYTPFCGIFDGKDMTISGINYTYDPGLIVSDPSAVNSIGLFGQLGASSSEPIGVGIVKNVNLKDCTFATDYDKTFYVGGIAGYIDRGGIYNSTVSGSTVSASNTNSHTGAIFGHKNSDFVALQNNHYTFDTNVTLGSGTSATTASGYTKRGGYVGTAWGDITADEGAMLYVKKATVPPVNANGSKVEFNEVEKGNNRYDFGTDDDFYYAVGQPITLKVTTGTSTDGDIRTFYDELKALTMNGTDISGAKSFTMPEADATIAATFAPSDWFTIPSNGKQYMSFYHKWTTGGGTSASPVNANYAVTDYAGNETIGALTITNASIVTGKITTGDLNGVCYYDMPTLFYCKNGLPAILKFTPDAKASTNVKAWEKFKGTTVDKDMREFANVYVLNGIGDFYLSDITDTDYTLKAHHCYIAVGNIAGVLPARLHINGGEDTGIDDPRIDNTGDNGLWFTIDGRRMDSRPQKKGIYINGGRKVVIK